MLNLILTCLAGVWSFSVAAQKPAQMETKWSDDAFVQVPWDVYPRPQMQRGNWTNLNGKWDYTITSLHHPLPKNWSGKINVPFAVESYLSTVGRSPGADSLLWYHTRFSQKPRSGNRVLLHFGAVDYAATVYVNGRKIGTHRGGYTAFSFDITDALIDGEQELVLSVWDPTDKGEQARGKQVSQPGGIYYTPVTGIWQTVWFEMVPDNYISGYTIKTDFDTRTVTITPNLVTAATDLELELEVFRKDSYNRPHAMAAMHQPLVATVGRAHAWSPVIPYLYEFSLRLKRGRAIIDEVDGYFGFRKIEVKKDSVGIDRIFFNNEALFQCGPLDQGYWPDGLYTAPSEEAMITDIRRMKAMGFNMVRKHVKVEPANWYYQCDKLGLIVWQDMPSGYGEIVPLKDHVHATEGDWLDKQYADVNRSEASAEAFKTEWKEVMQQLQHSPSVSVWVPFNEGWGQFNTNEIIRWTKAQDSSRLVDGPSGWIDRGEGDLRDYHLYDERLNKDFPLETGRALVVGEFGGLGYLDSLHAFAGQAWSYKGYKTREELTAAYDSLIGRIVQLKKAGFSAAVYTQYTDVETEINGLITYDRAMLKIPAYKLRGFHKRLYKFSRR